MKLPDRQEGEEEEANIFQLYHKNTLYYTFKAVDNHTAQRWGPLHNYFEFVEREGQFKDNSVTAQWDLM